MRIGDLVPWKSGSLSEQERVDPFLELRHDMNRLFDSFMDDDFFGRWPEMRLDRFSPRMDVADKETEIVVSAELPGMDEEDVEVTLTADALTIKGEKKTEHEEKDGNAYRMERSYGQFSRTIPLPNHVVDQENATASFKNGVLTITLPKLPEAQAVVKSIAVSTGE